MEKFPNLVSMEIDPPAPPEESEIATPAYPVYPCGMSVCFEEQQLEKLDVDTDDWEVGDVFRADVAFKITSKSENESTDGKRRRVEAQIIAMQGEEEEEAPAKRVVRSPYE